MASPPPAKSQPLHNFPMPKLQWSKNHSNNHYRRRRVGESSSLQSPPVNVARSPPSPPMLHFDSKSESACAAASSSQTPIEKSKPDQLLEERKTNRIQTEREVFMFKTWNFRPRRPQQKQPNSDPVTCNKAAQLPPTAEGDKSAAKKKKNPKLSIALKREEIEEDFCAMTGARPPKKPKKRAKAVQRQLDNLFPGMWLRAATPDTYKVSDAPKG